MFVNYMRMHTRVKVLEGCFLFVLGVLALWQSVTLRQQPPQDLLPWQQDRFHPLLLVAGIWLIVAGAIVLAAPFVHELRWKIAARSFRPRASLMLALFIVIFIAAYSALSITRHQRFNSTGYDLAISEQIVWNTLHGRPFASSPEVDNALADHFQPFFLFIVPFYALFPSTLTLLVLQAIVLGLGAIPLYLLARDRLQSPLLALALASVYLLYPALGFVNRFDFHIEVFAVPAFIAAFYALEHDRPRQASLWLIVPLLCKENMGLSTAAFGLYALLVRHKYTFGAAWIALGLLTFGLTSFWLIPMLRGEAADTFTRYEWLSQSPQIWQQISNPWRQLYVLQLLLPLGFLVLWALPELLMAAPGFALNLLAQHYCQSAIYCQYTVPIIPFLFIAVVFGLFRLKSVISARWAWQALGLALVPLTLIGFAIDNPFNEEQAVPTALTSIDNAAFVSLALQTVPVDASVVTSNDYAPHLAQRERLYVIGFPTQRAAPIDPDIVFINLYDQDYIVCTQYREYVTRLDLVRYGVVFRTGGLIVIQKDAGSNESFRDFILNWNDCAG